MTTARADLRSPPCCSAASSSPRRILHRRLSLLRASTASRYLRSLLSLLAILLLLLRPLLVASANGGGSHHQEATGSSLPAAGRSAAGSHHAFGGGDDRPAPYIVIIHNDTQLHELEALCASGSESAHGPRAASLIVSAVGKQHLLDSDGPAVPGSLLSGEDASGFTVDDAFLAPASGVAGVPAGGSSGAEQVPPAWTLRCRKHVGGLCKRVYFHTLRGFSVRGSAL